MKKAVILLSGGLDSTTCLAVAKRDGFVPVALSIVYGQRHAHELESAKRVAQAMGVVDHRVVAIDLRAVGGSSLTDAMAVPKHEAAPVATQVIPTTYVPARNTVFLAVALGLAEVVGAQDIFIGVNAVDYSGYPDCRPEFIDAFAALAKLATKGGVEGSTMAIHAPLAGLTKKEIICLGTSLGVDYALTHSCYDPLPDGAACGRCDSCWLRRSGFEAAGLSDPTRYAS